jgi:serine/threonine-protein kinase HipA
VTTKTRRLAVVLYGQLAGIIQRNSGSLTFTYGEEYLDTPRATPLSLSMPLTTTTYTNKWVEAYLRGLLPDNDEVRRRWASHFGLRDRDTFGLIAAIGSDAAGGALFLPEDKYPEGLSSGHVEPIAEPAIAERLRRLRADSTDWLGDDEHWSLAGTQSKFTLRATTSGWGIAHGAEPSTHIVKPGISRIPGQALIEHISMVAAGSLGLEVATTVYTEFEDQSAIVVERSDRTYRNGRLMRVHQEDLCQTFGLNPSRKYEADGGPGVHRIADRLRDATTDDSVRRFAKAVVVNYLLGAPDAHAKNYSLLLVGQAARLAPLYDLASGLTADTDGRLGYPKGAMSIGGERAFGAVQRRHWDGFSARVGLPPEEIREWVASLASAVPDAVSDAVQTLTASVGSSPDVVTLVSRVRRLAEMTARGLEAAQSGRRVGPAADEEIAAVSARP